MPLRAFRPNSSPERRRPTQATSNDARCLLFAAPCSGRGLRASAAAAAATLTSSKKPKSSRGVSRTARKRQAGSVASERYGALFVRCVCGAAPGLLRGASADAGAAEAAAVLFRQLLRRRPNLMQSMLVLRPNEVAALRRSAAASAVSYGQVEGLGVGREGRSDGRLGAVGGWGGG